jgi:hypothetical protein
MAESKNRLGSAFASAGYSTVVRTLRCARFTNSSSHCRKSSSASLNLESQPWTSPAGMTPTRDLDNPDKIKRNAAGW